MNWQVYIIRCSDQSLYTGITNNVERRWRQHATRRGAKYFRGREPLEIVYLEPGAAPAGARPTSKNCSALRRNA